MKKKLLKRLYLLILLTALFLQQFALAAGEDEWPLSSVGWTGKYDGSGVRVAVIDTGISGKYLDPSHILEGKNYVFPDSGTDDLVGHGTCIAGILLGSESLGITGVAPGCELVPLVYYSMYPSGVPENGGVGAICSAIYDAVDVYGCRIINISSGTPSDDGRLDEAAAYAEEKGVLVISSVGNDNITAPENIYYPAACGTVVGVGAADTGGWAAQFSQRNFSVKLLAPGVGIPAVPLGNSEELKTVSGSSYSAAYVTGAAARLLECSPGLTPAQLREILYGSAADVGETGYDIDSGWGILSLNACLAAAERYLPFADVESGSWYYDAVLSCYRAGLFTGTGRTGFFPNIPMTRAMFVTLLYRLEGEPEIGSAAAFDDVKDGMWYTDAVSWAAFSGLVLGTGDGRFQPEGAVSRQDMVTIMNRYALFKGIDLSVEENFDLTGYADAPDINGYAYDAFRWACASGLISGNGDGLLCPKDNATRAQAAVLFLRYINIMTEP